MSKVAVLLSSYNGEKYIESQIESILNQKEVEVHLFIRDDGSTDNTPTILEKYKEKATIFSGNNLGYGRSFFELIYKVPSNFDFYSFSDQDDYWEPLKMKKGIEKIKEKKYKEDFCLYFSSLSVVDENLDFIKMKSFKNMKISLGSVFVRNRTAGCTYIFNNQLLCLVKKVDVSSLDKKIEHDGLIMKICLACEGEVLYDNCSYINYRQHSNNVTGVKQGVTKRIQREFINLFKDKKEKNLNSSYAMFLLNNLDKKVIDTSEISLLNKISNVRTFRNKVKLIFSNKFKSGVFLFDCITYTKMILNIY